MSRKSLEEKEEELPREKDNSQETDKFDPSLRAIFEELKGQNELALRRRESLEKKSLDLSAFAGVILGIISYRLWGVGDKIVLEDPICVPFIFLVLSIFFNLGTIIPGKVYIGLVPCQLDELDSWKTEGTFDKTQLYKRLIEEYGKDCTNNEKLGLQRWFWHNVGVLSFVAGVASIPLIFVFTTLQLSYWMLLVWTVLYLILVCSYYRYRRWMKDFDRREKRFNELVGDEKWKKLGSRHTQ